MIPKPKDLKQEMLNESALIYDESTHEWVVAYRKDFKRFKCVTFLKEILFNDTAQAYTSEPFECIAYAIGLLKINLDVTSSPTDIYFNLEFSDNLIDWHKYMKGPFGDLRYEDSAGDKKECLDFPVLDRYVRIYAVSSGCDSSNTFKITFRISFSG